MDLRATAQDIQEQARELWRHVLGTEMSHGVPIIAAALAAVQQETQEACAKVADEIAAEYRNTNVEYREPYGYGRSKAGKQIATAIRALRAPKAPRPEATRSASSQQVSSPVEPTANYEAPGTVPLVLRGSTYAPSVPNGGDSGHSLSHRTDWPIVTGHDVQLVTPPCFWRCRRCGKESQAPLLDKCDSDAKRVVDHLQGDTK